VLPDLINGVGGLRQSKRTKKNLNRLLGQPEAIELQEQMFVQIMQHQQANGSTGHSQRRPSKKKLKNSAL